MPKATLQRFLPNPKVVQDRIQNNKYLRPFRGMLDHPNLWHLNRYSVATAISIGLFAGYLPLPGHMITGIILALFLKANIPLAATTVWFSNPFTMGPMFYFAYKVGAFILHIAPEPFHFEASFQWLFHEIGHIGLPLLIGCLLCGMILAILGNIAIRLTWRYSIGKAWRKRRKKRNN
jgi:uncharacterized protein (DUF2062 family)